MLLGGCGEMCYLNKLLMLSVLGWLFQVRRSKNSNLPYLPSLLNISLPCISRFRSFPRTFSSPISSLRSPSWRRATPAEQDL